MTKFSELCPDSIVYKNVSYDPSIKGITADSRKVYDNYIFVAIDGCNYNGENFIPAAIKRGAKVIITKKAQYKKFQKSDCIFLTSNNVRKTYAEIASKYYKEQPKLIVGVTGTNGKTSTAWYTNKIWTLSGIKSASIGTLGIDTGESIKTTNLTTPDPVILSKTLRDLEKNKVRNTIIEASSHGLSQYRLGGIKFSISAITSLGRDHLDYHKTYSNYVESKLKLFKETTIEDGVAIINSDIQDCNLFIRAAKIKKLKIISVGKNNRSNWSYKVIGIKDSLKIIEVSYKGKKTTLNTNIVGNFQISNLLISMAIALESGLSRDQIERIIPQLSSPPGRLENVVTNNRMPSIFIDYAHTPDALENSLKALRPYVRNKLVVVFGCGGNRDKGKRPLMGKIAQVNSDKIIVTDDNPRSENPSDIRSQIIKECPDAIEIPDRKEAIYSAIKNLTKGDVLLVAGKGHETQQIYHKEKRFFSDKKVIKEIIK